MTVQIPFRRIGLDFTGKSDEEKATYEDQIDPTSKCKNRPGKGCMEYVVGGRREL
ncbi:MAG: hypothetical protein VST66_08520 [Nitrospirota bacterium]|nr:hypothetical protein [Nitrospirota bacterium]